MLYKEAKETRCAWATNELLIEYHDTEWGVPKHEDQLLFEYLVLNGAQAGLSWLTILKRRGAYRKAFLNFDPQIVTSYGEKKSKNFYRMRGLSEIEGKSHRL